MAEQLGTKLGKWLYEQGKIDKSQIDLIRYSFEILCSEITKNIVIFGYGILSNQLYYTLMYLIFFHTLRHYFQGYHAKTISRCLTLTIGAYLTAMFFFMYVTYTGGIMFLLISFGLQTAYCIRKHQFMPIIVSALLKLAILLLAIIINNFSFLQLLIITELIVSVSTLFGKEDK